MQGMPVWSRIADGNCTSCRQCTAIWRRPSVSQTADATLWQILRPTSTYWWPSRNSTAEPEKHRDGRRTTLVAKSSAGTDTKVELEEENVQIEGIDRAYCDDFVCTSSPQVEQNVRALAREITRISTWTLSLFRKDILYKDSYLSLRGPERYKRLKFVKEVVGNPKVLVTKLLMLDKGKAQIFWRLRGSIAVFPIDVDFSSVFELDLITGKVFSQLDTWDLQRCAPPAKAAFLASRLVWSLGIRAAVAKEKSGEFLDSLASRDEDDQSNIQADPMDPTKFFQDNSDPTKDLFSIGLIVAFVWLIYRAYGEIEKL